jgi:carbonic anhydrase
LRYDASVKQSPRYATDRTEGGTSVIQDDILAYNRSFVESREYERYRTDKYPDKKLAIVSCMDTRLSELLMASLGLKNGDAKIIKVAGAEVSNPFGSVMRSIIIAVCELGVEDVMVVAHTNCGAQHMNGTEMVEHMKRLGVSEARIDFARHCGIDFDRWLAGFGDTEEAVRKSVDTISHHPVMPPHVRIGGYIMDSETGELTRVC